MNKNKDTCHMLQVRVKNIQQRRKRYDSFKIIILFKIKLYRNISSSIELLKYIIESN